MTCFVTILQGGQGGEGDPGADGDPGQPGKPGYDGTPGKNGTDGAPGKRGIQGNIGATVSFVENSGNCKLAFNYHLIVRVKLVIEEALDHLEFKEQR